MSGPPPLARAIVLTDDGALPYTDALAAFDDTTGPNAPAPSFTAAPSITGDGSPQVGEQLTGNDGTISNGGVQSRAWLLNGSVISGATGSTYTPTQAGNYSFRVTAAGSGGSATATSAGLTVAAAPVVTPAPAFTAQPSISPGSGTAGQTFTATDGTTSNATSITRRWLLGGTAIGTGTTVTPNAAGSLVLENTATGAGGSTTTTSSAVTVTAAAASSTAGTTPAGWSDASSWNDTATWSDAA